MAGEIQPFICMKPFDLIVYVLAVWRVSSLFVGEAGPFRVFLKLRAWAGIRHDDTGRAVEIPDNFSAQLFSCVWCFSIWVGFFLTIFWLVSPEWSLKFSVPFALSGGAVCIEVWRTSRK